MNRCFLHYDLTINHEHLKISREHLNYLSLSGLHELPNQNLLPDEDIQSRNTILLSVLHDDINHPLEGFCQACQMMRKLHMQLQLKC